LGSRPPAVLGYKFQIQMARTTPTTWNHRVLLTEQDGEKSCCIHEVHYNKRGKIVGWTKDPIAVCSDSLDTDRVPSLFSLK